MGGQVSVGMMTSRIGAAVTLVAAFAGIFLLITGKAPVLTPDQQGFRYFEQGDYEKFRPYGLPSDDWLRWTGEQLQRK